MKKIICFIILIGLSTSAFGTSVSHSLDVSYAFNKNSFLNSFSYKPMFGFFSNDRFKIGVGIRYSGFMGGKNLEYKRVDSNYSSTNSYLLSITHPQTFSFNTMFETTYTFWEKLEVGFNIDLIGYGFGRSRTSPYQSPTTSLAGLQDSDVPNFNLLLVGKHDKGQLNSEFFLGYQLNSNVGVRIGFSHLVTEQQSSQNLDGENRFRHLGYFGFAALNYTL